MLKDGTELVGVQQQDPSHLSPCQSANKNEVIGN